MEKREETIENKEWENKEQFVCLIIDRKSLIYKYNMVTHKGYKSNN